MLLRLKAKPSAVGAAALVSLAVGPCRRPCRLDQLRNGQAGLEHLLLQGSDVLVVDQLVVDLRYRVLPELRLGNPWSEVTGERSHVTGQQLVPRFGEGLGPLLRGIQPALGYLAVDRVPPQRDVGNEHRRGAARPAKRIRDRARARAILCGELPCAGGAFGQLPLVAVQ